MKKFDMQRFNSSKKNVLEAVTNSDVKMYLSIYTSGAVLWILYVQKSCKQTSREMRF